VFSNLDGRQPNPTGCAEHKQGFAQLEAAAVGQRKVSRTVGNRKRSGGDIIHQLRNSS